MNCRDYLSMLSTSPVEELTRGPARDHLAGCRDCDLVTQLVAEGEHDMLVAFDDVHPSVSAGETAARALTVSRRRRVARRYQIGLSMATAATIFYMTMTWRAQPTPPPGTRVSATFRLQCLSPEQAAEVLHTHLQPTGGIVIWPSSRRDLVKVEASPEMMVTVRSLLDRYDSPAQSQCAGQVKAPRESSSRR